MLAQKIRNLVAALKDIHQNDETTRVLLFFGSISSLSTEQDTEQTLIEALGKIMSEYEELCAMEDLEKEMTRMAEENFVIKVLEGLLDVQDLMLLFPTELYFALTNASVNAAGYETNFDLFFRLRTALQAISRPIFVDSCCYSNTNPFSDISFVPLCNFVQLLKSVHEKIVADIFDFLSSLSDTQLVRVAHLSNVQNISSMSFFISKSAFQSANGVSDNICLPDTTLNASSLSIQNNNGSNINSNSGGARSGLSQSKGMFDGLRGSLSGTNPLGGSVSGFFLGNSLSASAAFQWNGGNITVDVDRELSELIGDSDFLCNFNGLRQSSQAVPVDETMGSMDVQGGPSNLFPLQQNQNQFLNQQQQQQQQQSSSGGFRVDSSAQPWSMGRAIQPASHDPHHLPHPHPPLVPRIIPSSLPTQQPPVRSKPAPTSSTSSSSSSSSPYQLKIVTQPAKKLVYQRIIKPFPSVSLLRGLDGETTLFVEALLVRIDNDKVLPDILQGDTMVRVSTNEIAHFKRLKITSTSQMQGCYFKIKFLLKRYDSTEGFSIVDDCFVLSDPIQVVSHTQYLPIKGAKSQEEEGAIIQEIVPRTAGPGDRLVIIGAGFVNSPNLRVRFQDQLIEPRFHEAGTLLCQVPPLLPSSIPIQVTNDGVVFSSPFHFEIKALSR